MPELYFTPHQESTWLSQNGYSPDEFYIDAASGSVLPKVKKPSTINTDLNISQLPVNKPTTEDNKFSVAASFGIGAGTGALPNISAVATGGRVASALLPLATELAPSTRGLSYAIPAIGGIGSGLLASLGLNKLQDAILPNSIKQKIQQASEDNPGSFLSGQIVSQLPVLKPSVGNLIRGAKTAGQIGENLITGGARPVAGADVSNLINTTLGAGTGAGSAIVPNLIQGRDISPLEVALSTAGGALFSEPTKLGQKLGKLTPTTPREDIEGKARRLQGEEGESLYERADRLKQAGIKARFLEEEPKGLRASLIKAETGTPADKLPQKQFDISETDVRPRTYYSESKTNDKGESKYLIPFNKISKEDKQLFPSLVNEKGSLRAGVDEAMFREKLDERLYGDEFREYKNLLEEAQETKKQVDIREQQERTAELASREQKVLQNITQASVEERGKLKPEDLKPVEPKKAEAGGTEYGERKFTTEQLGAKPVTTLRQKSFNKELNYKLWKDAWKKASIEGNDLARKEAERLLEPGFADRYVLEEIHGKPQTPFSEVESLEPVLSKTKSYKKELSPVERKPEEVPRINETLGRKTVFEEEGQGLSVPNKINLGEHGDLVLRSKDNESANFYLKKGELELGNISLIKENDKWHLQSIGGLPRGKGIGSLVVKKLVENLGELRSSGMTSPDAIKMWKRLGASTDSEGRFSLKSTKIQPGEQSLKGNLSGEIPTERLSSAKKIESEVPATKLNLKAKTFDYMKKVFGPLRNVDIKEDADINTKGVATLREGVNKTVAKINPFTASLDTLGHEPLHVFLNDLETSPHKIDNEIVQGFYKAVEQSDDFKRVNADRIARGKKPFDANEIATEEAGIEFARRLLNPKNMEGTLKRKWTDLMGRIRVKWGKAGVEDYTRLLTEKFFRDPSFVERYGSTEVKTTTTNQETKEKEETYANEISKSNEPSDSSQEGFEEGRLSSGEEQIQRSSGSKEEVKEAEGRETKLKSEESEQGLIQPERPTNKEEFQKTSVNKPKLSQEEQIKRFVNDSNIAGRLSDASMRSADEVMHARAMKERTEDKFLNQKRGDKELREDLMEELWSELAKKDLQPVNDEQSKSLEIAAELIRRGNKDIENHYREIIGDEAMDEILANIRQYAANYTDRNLELFREKREAADKLKEKAKLHSKKAEELEAFERTDVERHSEAEQGLKTPKNINEDLIRNKIIETFKNRTGFKDIKPINIKEQIGLGFVRGQTKSEVTDEGIKTKVMARPADTATAAHEMVHSVTIENYPDFIKYATSVLQNAPKEALLRYAKLLKTYSVYTEISEHLENIAKGKPSKYPWSDGHAVGEIMAQVVEQSSDFGRTLDNLSKKILGDDVYNTLKKEIKIHHPKWKGPDNQAEIDSLYGEARAKMNQAEQTKYDESIGDVNERARLRFQLRNEANELREKAIELEASGSFYESNEQGLKTPEEILRKIKSLRTDPSFQKESTFKRGIKDVISSRIPIFGDDITKLEVRGGEEGKLIAPALREYFAKDREYEGRYLNPVADALNKLDNDELDNLYATMLSERKQRKSLRDTLDTKSQEVYDVIRETLKQKQEEQIAAGQPVQDIGKDGKIKYRLPRIDPFYMPEIVGSKQLDILLNATGSAAFNNLKRDFINFQKTNYDLNDTQAKKMFSDLIASYGGPVKGDTTHFGAVRRSEGFGLPESWLESSMALAMRRYWRRVAKDRAFYDSIENDDNLLKIIGHTKDAHGEYIKPSNENLESISGNETFSNIMDIIQGRFIKTNPRLDAFGRIASNLVLGPITGITDLINAAPILAKFIPSAGNIPGFLAASMNLVDGIKAAKRTGLIRENITSIGDITSPSDEFVERLRKGADVVSKVNTREYLEKASRGLSQSLADYLIGVHLKLAEKGNQKSINLLEGLANKQDYTKLSQEQLASRLAELGQGTYDPRGLPSWAIDSQIAPFFRLAKWNIEQLNNLHKHVIIPATKGNITPLLMTLGGGLLGGYMAKEVREKLNNKKQAMPEWKEIFESKPGLKGNIPDATYNLAAAISYSGVTGLLGDLTKAGFDVAFKNTPQGFNFPLIEIVGDTAVKVNQAVTAITDGENPIDVMTQLTKDLAINHTQIARITAAQTLGRTAKNKQQVEDTESRRNLRTFKMVENKPYNAQGIQNESENPYVGLDTKRFKRRSIDELPKAAKEAGELVNKAMREEDFSTREKKLSGLKRMNFQTIPSPTADPMGFAQFVDFNNRVRGDKDTKKRLQRFFEQSNSNKIKASFVP